MVLVGPVLGAPPAQKGVPCLPWALTPSPSEGALLPPASDSSSVQKTCRTGQGLEQVALSSSRLPPSPHFCLISHSVGGGAGPG